MKTKENHGGKKVDHTSHRQRLYQNVEKLGLENMNEYMVLEFILTYVLPRVDTNPTAHLLLDKFGSVANVLDSSAKELETVKGMGKNASRLLSLFPQIFSYYQISKQKTTKVLKNRQAMMLYCKSFLLQKKNEELYAICLDKNSKVLSTIFLAKGEVNQVNINQKELLRQVLNVPNAHFLILTHSHPNGSSKPSFQDTETTKKLRTLFATVDINLFEHVIVGENNCYCIVEGKYYDN